MKTSFYHGNQTITIDETDPVPPGPGEVRLGVAYCGICGTDRHIYHGAMDKRVAMPQTIGHEASALVLETGAGVSGFKPGDAVVVRPLDSRAEIPTDRGYSHICSGLKFIGIDAPGAFQQSWTVPAFTLHKVPEGIDLKTAALAEPLAVACHDVRLGKVKPGECVAVIGGGPIGLLVAFVARQAGARVLLFEVNPARCEQARGFGLEAVNPLETDWVACTKNFSDGVGMDVVFEVSGAKSAALGMTELLAIRGRVVVVAIYPQPVELNLFHFFWKELSLLGARVYEPEDYEKALELMACGSLPLEKLITRVEPLHRLPEVMAELDQHDDGIKTLIDCRAD